MALQRLTLVSVLLVAACGAPKSEMKLYPLEGPIAAENPTLVIDVNAKNTDMASGPMTFRLPGRVKCTGTWTSVAPREISRNRGVSLTLSGPKASLGKETTMVGGVNNGEIYAVCTDGTKVQGSFLVGSGTVSGTGRATDTNGNVYKLLF